MPSGRCAADSAAALTCSVLTDHATPRAGWDHYQLEKVKLLILELSSMIRNGITITKDADRAVHREERAGYYKGGL
jgi:hypothetical protein